MLQSTYHGRGQKCASVEVKLEILRERMRGNQDTANKLAADLKKREQELLSLATIQVHPSLPVREKDDMGWTARGRGKWWGGGG
jgi:hypothetical protein